MKLLLSLGHGSSATLVKGKKILCAYEEERFSKVKSDSSYPKLSIEKLLDYYPEARREVHTVYISHWFNLDGKELSESKYFLPKHLSKRFPFASVVGVNQAFTHHDAHAASVWNFSNTKEGLTMVADGFGNDGETVSFYRDGALVKRLRLVSLGLLYQYTTSFLGMRENQDEYKLLGYESQVDEETADRLKPYLKKYFDRYVNEIIETPLKRYEYMDVVKFNKKLVTKMLEDVGGDRIALAYFVQSLLEDLVLYLLDMVMSHKDRTLQFAGGIFYNVKLNNRILNKYAGRITLMEFMPLAGDLGAPLGMIEGLEIPHLFLGRREVTNNSRYRIDLDDFEFVFKDWMEFGPRALGNTSCIAKPTAEMTVKINKMNGRPNIMPMAPMISSDLADQYCRNIVVLGRCKHFMIVATDWCGPIEEYRGVLHNKPLEPNTYTCRPQVVDNEYTKKYGVVINTSLNAHGQPILYNDSDYVIMEWIHAQELSGNSKSS